MFTDPEEAAPRQLDTIGGERRPPSSDPTMIAGAGDDSVPPSLSPLCKAHARWAALKQQRDVLYSEIDEREAEAGYLGVAPRGRAGRGGFLNDEPAIDAMIDGELRWRPCSRAELEQDRAALKSELVERRRDFEAGCERLGVPTLRAELDAIEATIEAVLDELYELPIASLEDVAVFLDVILGQNEIELGCEPDHEHASTYLAFTARLLQELLWQVPGFDFLALRRLYPQPEKLAFLLGADDGEARLPRVTTSAAGNTQENR